MFCLPTKFTGIDSEMLSFEGFKNLCYSLQGLGAFNVETVEDWRYPKNYYEASVSDPYVSYFFLQNCYVPYACCRILEDEQPKYLDIPNLAPTLESIESNIILLGSGALVEQITKEHQSQLTHIEAQELKEWLPDTIGGALFSCNFD